MMYYYQQLDLILEGCDNTPSLNLGVHVCENVCTCMNIFVSMLNMRTCEHVRERIKSGIHRFLFLIKLVC